VDVLNNTTFDINDLLHVIHHHIVLKTFYLMTQDGALVDAGPRKISLVFSVGLEGSLSKLREVRASVDPARRYEGRACDGRNMAAPPARSSVVLLAH
jgi:hypothetical protein